MDIKIPEHIEQFFGYTHLPQALAEISAPFASLASHVLRTLPRNPERTVALRKLLEAKDAAVRAYVAREGVSLDDLIWPPAEAAPALELDGSAEAAPALELDE